MGAIAEVLANPAPEALVVGLADSSIQIRIRWWVRPPQQFEVYASQDAVLERVIGALRSAGVNLPFPTHQILLHDQTDEFDGDRSRQREGWPPPSGNAPKQARTVDVLQTLLAVRRGALDRDDAG